MKVKEKKTTRRAIRRLKMKKDQKEEKARILILKKKAVGKAAEGKVVKEKGKEDALGDSGAPPGQEAVLEFEV